jgi:hypothetical protein
MNSIKLGSASKAEIIRAINKEFSFGDVRERIERSMFWSRQEDLLEEMKKACEDMDANRHSGKFDPAKRLQWKKANERWSKANSKLSKMQGTD